MTGASGPGVWPGIDSLEAYLTIFGDLAEVPEGVRGLPFVAQLPARGAGALPVARTAALLADMPVELGPHGWKLSDHPGMDLDRAKSLLREDLDALAVAGHGYSGPITVQVVGPWTLAATLYLARGDRVLADRGAVAELAGSLALGIGEHVAAVRAQVPGAQVTVQVDESLLGQVAAGVIPTFSGYSRLRAVRGPDLLDALSPVLEAARAAQARSVVHVGQAWVGIAPVVLAGADAVGVELGAVTDGPAWNEHGWELVARAIERGTQLWAGLPPATVSQCAGTDVRGLADLVSVPWRRMGLPLSGLDDVVLTSAGSAATLAASGTPDAARGALGSVVRAAAILAERAAG
ncbi:hypothetical protein SAMN05216410_3416 [Sanguibacter gelidistatuariae]|uniref:Methionine synthase n=1 Tax=Sanguibacter gelidistatuariae TaxID=1814289 RepID=A0A1G6VDZ9_9MICO|nr:hypothetical protein [Sanguibacter gelidistatuariae]SDD51930.1 hypothetical protein SAMN05216410_3416 [Sanguibacter gelidistatuariae]